MKKKLTSVLALSMAMVLTFGMTVFAEESPNTENTSLTVKSETVKADTTEPTDTTVVEQLNKEAETLRNGVEVTISSDAVTLKEVTTVSAGVLNNAKSVADTIAKKVVKAEADKTVVATPVAAADVKIEGEIPAEGITLTINLPSFKRDPAKNYMVLHLNGNVWETIDAVVGDGKITATFHSLSPIVVVEVEQKAGETTSNTNAGSSNSGSTNNASTTTATNPAESPKTGEIVPVAGVLTVICLASAVVCAKKVRYNK